MHSSEQNPPASLVEMIFAKCALVYGRDFLSRWEGLPLAEVKADWERELGGWLNRPHAVRHALENLPERPPHVLTFRAMCERAPEMVAPQLGNSMTQAEKVKAEEVRLKVMAKIRSFYTTGSDA